MPPGNPGQNGLDDDEISPRGPAERSRSKSNPIAPQSDTVAGHARQSAAPAVQSRRNSSGQSVGALISLGRWKFDVKRWTLFLKSVLLTATRAFSFFTSR